MRKKLFRLFIIFIGIVLLLYLALISSPVQTWLTGLVANSIAEKTGTEVSLEKIDIDWFSDLVLEGLLVKDQNKDTLIYVRELGLSEVRIKQNKEQVQIGALNLDGLYLRLHIAQGDSSTNLDPILEYFSSSNTTSSTPWKLLGNQIHIQNARFRFDDDNDSAISPGVDYSHIDLKNLNVKAKQVHQKGDSLYAKIDRLQFQEQSGFKLEDLQGVFSMNDKLLRLDEMHITTAESDLKGLAELSFKSFDDFSDFERKVKMRYEFKPSVVQLADVAYFAPDLWGLDHRIELSGKVRGKVNNLKGRKIALKFGEESSFSGRIDLSGLPNIDQTFITLDVDELITTKKDLDLIPLPPFEEGRSLKTPDNIASLGQMSFSGNFTGFINDFVANGVLSTRLGIVESDIKLTDDGDDIYYSGNLETQLFDLKTFYNTPLLGKVSSTLNVKGNGLKLEDLRAKLNGEIQVLDLNGYRYKNIQVDGDFKNKYFDGLVSIEDDRANFDFNGAIDFTQKIPQYNFQAEVRHIDLVELNLLEGDYTSMSGMFSLNGQGSSLDDFEGNISSDEVLICTNQEEYPIQHLELESKNNEGLRRIEIASNIANGYVEGNFNAAGLERGFRQILADIIPSLEAPKSNKKAKEDFKMELVLGDFELISVLFIPELHITPKSRLFLEMNDQSTVFDIVFTADTLQYMDYYATGLIADMQYPDSSLYLTVMTDRLQLADSLYINSFSIDARNDKDTIYTSLAWGESSDNLRGDINAAVAIGGNKDLSIDLSDAVFWVNDLDWVINDKALIDIEGKRIEVNDLRIAHKEQFLRIDGTIDENPTEVLEAEFQAINLWLLDPLILNSGIELDGIVSGSAAISNVYQDPLITADLAAIDFSINNYLLGDLCLESRWDDINTQLILSGELEKNKRNQLAFGGFYRPKDEESPLQVVAQIQDLELSFLNAFITEGISEIGGDISGEVEISGKLEAPQLEGKATFNQASVHVDYLNTTYFIEEEAGVYPDMFTLNSIAVYDEFNNKASLVGTILHDNFTDWNFDVFLDLEEEPFLVLNTEKTEGELYYGRAFASGYASVSGYANNLIIDVNARTESGTNIALPLGDSEEVAFDDFVTFVDYSAEVIPEVPVDLSGIDLKLEIDVTKDAQVRIIFDEAVGDEIEGRAAGHLTMDISNLSTFNMYGTLEVLEGDYLFTLKNLINKEFQVIPGGRISWFGDPLEAEIDLQAGYKLTAPLYDLMSEDAEQYRQRVPVDLLMNLSGDLLNPGITFDIQLPQSNEISRARVKSVINTEEEMNRQAFALLVLRRFVSPPNITKEHNSLGIAENSTELLSSQLSNWLSQISNDFDIGVNYRPGDEISNEELAVALSTQLFSDRLLLSGNFGVAYATGAQQNTDAANNLIGDLKVEYKVLPNGKIRIIVYNESNEFDVTNANRSNNTQGMGIVFQEEFNSLQELFRLKEK